MRHDRTGELVDEDQADEQPVDELADVHHCDGGWLDRDAEPAVPCLVCRPHLATPTPRRPPPDVDRIRRGLDLCRHALATRQRGLNEPSTCNPPAL